MNGILICLALIATSLAQETNTVPIEPPRPPIICPMLSPPKIPDGCHLETTMNSAHCPVPKVVCPSCDLLKCDETQQCRVVAGNAKCFAKMCPLTMPGRIPPGCTLENEVDENGCTRLHIVCSKSVNEDCGENMEMKSCGSPCPETCEQVVTGVYSKCPRKCIPNVCQCKQGFALDENNKCVARETCSHQPRSAEVSTDQCQENEELKECGSMCPTTCEMIVTGKYPPCPAMCKVNVCQCKDGYAYDAQQRCVKVEDCRHRAQLRGNRNN